MPIAVTFPAAEMTTPLRGAYSVNLGMKASAARDKLRQARFDQAPVVNDALQLCGWVRTANLGGRGLVSASVTPLEACAIQSLDTPVGDAIHNVASSGLVFFAGPSGITEFAVPSDLDRHVVRCYLYVVLAELEMLLANFAEDELPHEVIESLIRGRERSRYDAAREHDVEIRPVEYLMLSAYSGVIDRIRPVVATFPGTRNELRSTLKQLTRLRNCVAHPAKSLTAEFPVTDISRLARSAEALTTGLRAVRVPRA